MLSFELNDENGCKSQTVELDVDNNIVGIFGDSGAGKTSLLMGIAALRAGYVQQVQYQGKKLPAQFTESSPIYYLQQSSSLFPHLTVRQSLQLIIKHGVFASHTSFSIDEVIDWCQLSNLLNKKPMQLSGGQQQRVAFAQALLSGKSLILLDEPFSALDWQAREHFCRLLKCLHKQYQRQFIMVSHSIAELALSADYILKLKDFEVCQQGHCQHMLPLLSSQNAHTQRSLLKGIVVDVCEQYQLTKVRLVNASQQLIYIKMPEFLSDEISVPIDANKVSISKEKPTLSTIVNCLYGAINKIELNGQYVTVEVDVDGQNILANISLLSLDKLHLKCGEKVFVQFKAN